MVSVLAISFMAVSAAISFGLPIVLLLAWRKKYELKVIPMLYGAAAFFVFALILEQIMHVLVLRPGADGSISLVENSPFLYMVYGIFAAGIFEETARFLSFHLLKKNFGGIGTGLSYGIGHGGIEAILLAGLTMISSIIMSISINSGNAADLGSSPAILAQINELVGTGPALYLLSGLERIIAVTIHISLSMFVWCAVKVKGKLWLYPVSIVLHAVANIAPVMYQTGVIKNVLLVEVLILIPAVTIAFASSRVCKLIQQVESAESVTAD